MHPLFEKQEIHKRRCFGRLLCALRAADKNSRNLPAANSYKIFSNAPLAKSNDAFEAISSKLQKSHALAQRGHTRTLAAGPCESSRLREGSRLWALTSSLKKPT